MIQTDTQKVRVSLHWTSTIKPQDQKELLAVWFNSDIRHKLHKLHSLRKKQKRPNSAISSDRVASAELSMQAQMTEAKSEYETKLVNEFTISNNSKIYSYLRSFSKNDDLPLTLFLKSESAATSPSKAALFNKFFHSVFSKKLSRTSVCSLNLPISCSALLLLMNWIHTMHPVLS